MNQKAYIFFQGFIIAMIGWLQTSFSNEKAEETSSKHFIEGQTSVFFPQSSRFRRIYGDCAPVFGLQYTAEFVPNFEFWSGFSWCSKSSKHNRHCYHTSIKISNLSFGVNYVWRPLPKFDVCLGAGPIFGIVFLSNHSCCGHENTSSFALGGILRGETRWYFPFRIYLALFAEYFYQKTFFSNHVNIGGTKIGGGIGYRF